MIKGLHHNAYRCRDSEQTRQFYEGFLGLPLAGTLAIGETMTGRKTAVPFGPFLAAGTMAAIWVGQPAIDLILHR